MVSRPYLLYFLSLLHFGKQSKCLVLLGLHYFAPPAPVSLLHRY